MFFMFSSDFVLLMGDFMHIIYHYVSSRKAIHFNEKAMYLLKLHSGSMKYMIPERKKKVYRVRVNTSNVFWQFLKPIKEMRSRNYS